MEGVERGGGWWKQSGWSWDEGVGAGREREVAMAAPKQVGLDGRWGHKING